MPPRASSARSTPAATSSSPSDTRGARPSTRASTARFSRQNGIHVSPTFMVDGLVNERMGSRDEIGKWVAEIGLA